MSDLDKNEIRTTAVDFSFGEILNLHNDREIIIQPEYQRLFRWSNEQRSRLIESILMGLPIPPIFFIEGKDGVLELIDGLQRVSSVIQFLNHSAIDQPMLCLLGCDFLPELNGKSYEDLETIQKLKIKRAAIRATIILKSGSSFVKYEMFKRLNTGGALLSAQEIRNCSSRMVEGGEQFYEFLQRLANNQAFRNATSRLPDQERQKRADEELVLRFFALTYARQDFRGSIEEWLDGFMEAVLFRRVQFDMNKAESHFSECFSTIYDKLDSSAFSRFNADEVSIGRLAPAYFEAVSVAFSENMNELKIIDGFELRSRLVRAFASEEFRGATGPGANSLPKLNHRIEVVTNFLKKNGHP